MQTQPPNPLPLSASFSVADRRSLPVILLADTSGSMAQDGKIEAMNRAIAEMLDSFVNDADAPAQIQLAVIAFGGAEAALHLPLRPVEQVRWTSMGANGKTPLGSAIRQLGALISDELQVRRNSYYPTVVLLSDGQPTDDWREPLDAFLDTDRGRKTVRIAVAIGSDADPTPLAAFATDGGRGVLRADQVRQIHTFFRWLTVTIASRSRAPRPNDSMLPPPPSLDDIEF